MQHDLYFIMNSDIIGYIISQGRGEEITKEGKSNKKFDIIFEDLKRLYIKLNNIYLLFQL